jgi:hypothetical protein
MNTYVFAKPLSLYISLQKKGGAKLMIINVCVEGRSYGLDAYGSENRSRQALPPASI